MAREARIREVTEKTEKREWMKEKMCQHIDSNGHPCTSKKMQKKGSAHCYKHRPK